MLDHPLKAYRREKGLSLEALAEKAGTTAANLSRIEAGVHMPSVSLLKRLAGATGLAADVLIADRVAAAPKAHGRADASTADAAE